MANLGGGQLRTREDLANFEAEMTLEQRLPERSILDVFKASATARPTCSRNLAGRHRAWPICCHR